MSPVVGWNEVTGLPPRMMALRDLQARRASRRSVVRCAILIAVWAMGVLTGAKLVSTDHVATCQEDMACWDCHTDGNRICGPAEGSR